MEANSSLEIETSKSQSRGQRLRGGGRLRPAQQGRSAVDGQRSGLGSAAVKRAAARRMLGDEHSGRSNHLPRMTQTSLRLTC